MPTNQIINDVIPWTQASASNNQVIFDTNWTAAYASDVVVYQRGMNEEPDELTQILLESEYVVSFVGSGQMVRVTLLTPATTGDVVTITRNTAVDRLNLYTNTNFVPSMLNQDTALLTLVDQERAMLNRQSIKYHLTGLNPNYSLTENPPVVPLGPNQIWAMNPAGDAFIPYDVPEDGGIATDKATYILQEPHIGLPNSQALSLLPSGFLVSSAGTGVVVTRVIEGVLHQTVVTDPSGIGDNPAIGLAENAIVPGTAGMGIPAGTTAQRVTPTPPSIGMRFNTDLGQVEAYIGSQWVAIPSAASGLFLPLAGGTMTGDILMDGHIIDGLPLPSTDNEAASKIYVDNAVGGAAGGITGNLQWNNGGAFAGDPNFNTDGSGNVEIDGSFRIDNISFDGNRISPITGTVEIEDGELFNDLDAATNKIVNLGTCTNDFDAANKLYVDQTALNGTSVYAATTVNLTVTQSGSGIGATLTNAGTQAVFAIDGVSPPVGTNVLIKNLANAANQGIYTVTNAGSVSTNWVLTRATSYDTPVEINNTGLILVRNGTANTGTAWYNSATIITVDTTNFSYASFGLSLPVSVTNGGTGKTSVTSNNLLLGNGTSALAELTPGTGVLASLQANVSGSGNLALTTSPQFTTPNIGAATATRLTFSNFGTGGIQGVSGVTPAPSGYVGEFISATNGAGTSITSGVNTNITSISLTAGQWLVFGVTTFAPSGATTTSQACGTSNASASFGDSNNLRISTTASLSMPTPINFYSLSATSTIYLVAAAGFTGGTLISGGSIYAIRIH